MNLFRLELRKVLPYRTFWIILAVYTLLILLLAYTSQSITINNRQLGSATYQFPGLWLNITYLASFFNILLGILVIVLISDEYSFRTLRQQVIDGLSRAEIVLAKFYVMVALAAFGTIFLLILGLYFGLVYSLNTSANAIFSQSHRLFYYFIQAVGVMSLALLFSIIIRKSGLSIIALLAYVIALEPIIRSFIPDSIDKFFPLKVFSSLTPMPLQEIMDQAISPTEILSPAWAVLPAMAYIGLFLLLSYFVLKARDL